MRNLILLLLILKLSKAQQNQPNWQSWPDNTYQPGVCICVPIGSCNIASGGGNTDGRGALDPRISTVNLFIFKLKNI